ncbi:MAG: SOS response-associated peptidase family protein [Candidatus Woesearchaeota archaeon]
MCTRYALFSIPEEDKIRFGIEEYYKNYNISPYSECLIIQGGKAIKSIWGLKINDMSILNARVETYETKKLFSNMSRCIVLMNGFFEWKNKIPYYFYSDKILYACGIATNERFVILTCKANETVSNIHDRMPLLTKAPYDWIENKEHDNIMLNYHMVTSRMNNIHYKNSDGIIKENTLTDYS